MVRQSNNKRITFLLDNLSGGGAEKVMLNLAEGFARLGYTVDVLVCKMEGVLHNSIPAGVNLVPLKARKPYKGYFLAILADPGGISELVSVSLRRFKFAKAFGYIPAIADHLRTHEVDVLVSALPKSNINAVLAKLSSQATTRVVVGSHVHITARDDECYSRGNSRIRQLRPLMARYYQQADAVVAVSRGVAADTQSYLDLPAGHVSTIYNPVVSKEIQNLGKASVDHAWFRSREIPVILGMGRFVSQKDFPMLLRAFARVREKRKARLVLLGGDDSSGDQCRHKRELEDLASQLGVQDDVDMPGYKKNPYPYFREAAVFALSSRYEGFGNVLVEALLCGCPVVSTDCPSGPAEILQEGEYGRLVPVGDAAGFADAIVATLDAEVDKDRLRKRAETFSVDAAVKHYQELFFSELAIS